MATFWDSISYNWATLNSNIFFTLHECAIEIHYGMTKYLAFKRCYLPIQQYHFNCYNNTINSFSYIIIRSIQAGKFYFGSAWLNVIYSINYCVSAKLIW